MSELNQMGCEEFADVAAELALGVLTGRERAEALAHLDHCDACRETVRQLTSTGEHLLGLLPAIEPPPGFETRVMERIGLTAPAPRAKHRRPRAWTGSLSPRRLLAAAAVAAAIVAAGAGGWILRGPGTPGTQAAGPWSWVRSTALVSASHQAAGNLFYFQGNPGWLYMTVDSIPATGTGIVICQLVGTDGHVTTVGSFQLTNGYGSWGATAPASVGPLAGAQLVSPRGTVLATATFA